MRGVPDELLAIVATTVEGMGYELVGLEYRPSQRSGLLRVYIDQADGISVDDCAKVSYQLSGVLDVEDPIPGQYNLEISSPGLDRPLFKEKDFERFVGRQVKLRLTTPLLDGRKRLAGTLGGLESGQVVVDVDGERIAVSLDMVGEARLVPEL